LRKASPPPRSWRPVHLEGIADERIKTKVGFERPGVHDFSALLLDRCKRDERASGVEVCFFGKFPARRGEKIGVGFGEAFGDGPGPVLFLRPERAARMGEQNLERGGSAKCQETGANFYASAPLPKFVTHCGTSCTNFGSKRRTSSSKVLVPLSI